MRDISQYHSDCIAGLNRAAEMMRATDDPEASVACLARVAMEVLGDKDAHRRPGALDPGADDLCVSGFFAVSPDRRFLVLLAEHGFPPAQHRLRIDIADSRPGHTVRTGIPTVLPTTDGDPHFRQILSSARMGSAIYIPVKWRDQVLGMFNVAARARFTYDARDLEVAKLFGELCAANWMAKGGPRFLERLIATLPPWPAAG